jgi:arsenate reductase (thioredoxin)
MTRTVLFVCIHNSARSQMAEAFVNASCGDSLRAYSAGLQPGTLSATVIEVMREIGYDISQNPTKGVDDPEIRAREYDYVVTVCDEASAEACPIYSTRGERLHWPFADPSSFRGTHDDVRVRTRVVRDAIAARVRAWCTEVAAG